MADGRILLLGAAGQVGRALARALAGHALVLADRAPDALTSLAAELGAESLAGDLAATLEDKPLPADVALVVNAAGLEAARAQRLAARSLEAGAHWIDLDWPSGASYEELDELAKRAQRVAVFGAGIDCGLTAPFTAQLCEGMVRVNEVWIGLLVDPAARGLASRASWLRGFESKVRMQIGGEWTERDPFGDRRRFPHPPPIGEQVSENLAAPELELFSGRGYRSSSVRVSIAMPSGFERRALHAGGRAVVARRKAPELAAAKLGRLARWIGRGKRSSAVTWIVRGIESNRLPVERRLSAIAPASSLVLETRAALALAGELLGKGEQEPGAGLLHGRIPAAGLEQALIDGGATVVRGDLGGWKAPH